MKRQTARGASILLVLSIVIALFAGTFTVNAASNTATRHEICTTLSSQAVSYYTGSYTYEALSVLSGGTSSCLDTVGTPLFDALHDLMSDTMTKSISYSSLTSYWPTTDANMLFYSDFESTSYNREHVWPKSHASFHEQNGGCDLHHLRPTNSTINSTRGNYTFGNVKSKLSSYKTQENGGKTVLWYNTSYSTGGSDGLVEVLDNVKGDVARILLYVYVRWEEPNLFEKDPTPVIGPSDEKNDGKKVIEDLDTLLEWMEIDPVDEWEMTRNDLTQNVQGNRNVFIDYPEFAWLLFGEEVPSGMTTPSGGAGNGSGGSSTPSCTHANTELRNVASASCTQSGYTGDTYCKDCNTKLSSGSSIPATDHKDNNSDDKCDTCGAVLKAPTIADGSYAKVTDGKLTTGQYVLVTSNGYAPGVLDGSWITSVQPTISGNTVTDAKGAVWTLIVSGSSVTLTDANGVSVAPKGGNNNGISSGEYQWAWSASNGGFIFQGTGSDTVRLAQNTGDSGGNQYRAYKISTATGSYAATYPSVFTLYKLVAGDDGSGGNTPSCTHTNKEVRNATTVTCIKSGYTGDTYCKDCGEKLSSGNTLSATGHADANQDNVCDTCKTALDSDCDHRRVSTGNAVAATCTTDGYSGDVYCEDCSIVLKPGETIPATGHTDADSDNRCDSCSAELNPAATESVPPTEETVPPTTEGTITTVPATGPATVPSEDIPAMNTGSDSDGSSPAVWIVVGVVILLAAGVAVFIIMKKKKSTEQ